MKAHSTYNITVNGISHPNSKENSNTQISQGLFLESSKIERALQNAISNQGISQNYEELLEIYAKKYCLHDFCSCPTFSDGISKHNLSNNKSLEFEIKENHHTLQANEGVNSKNLANASPKTSDFSRYYFNKNFTPPSTQSSELASSSTRRGKFKESSGLKAKNKTEKRLERSYTNTNSRKDVVYKAILRFMKRRFEENFRTSQLSSPCYSGKTTNSAREVMKYLSQSGEAAEDKLAHIFISIIDPRREHKRYGSSCESFRKEFNSCLSRFNFKHLLECTKNKYFSSLFLNFWTNQTSWEDFVNSINQKREEPISTEAYKHYLDKLIVKCQEVLSEDP
ncbi:unnamed protein product [Moneuplotes crassus]|uniref:Uncharacterized protein n=1 Tax=Euplotes crassus TaxID=5936 RepID=A0AAD1Y2J6_EUPCR|nr:unnamed protein product [Moneuplotes crassus]